MKTGKAIGLPHTCLYSDFTAFKDAAGELHPVQRTVEGDLVISDAAIPAKIKLIIKKRITRIFFFVFEISFSCFISRLALSVNP